MGVEGNKHPFVGPLVGGVRVSLLTIAWHTLFMQQYHVCLCEWWFQFLAGLRAAVGSAEMMRCALYHCVTYSAA